MGTVHLAFFELACLSKGRLQDQESQEMYVKAHTHLIRIGNARFQSEPNIGGF